METATARAYSSLALAEATYGDEAVARLQHTVAYLPGTHSGQVEGTALGVLAARARRRRPLT